MSIFFSGPQLAWQEMLQEEKNMNTTQELSEALIELLGILYNDECWETEGTQRSLAKLTKRLLDKQSEPAEPQEPDASKCPKCGGPADNGHDRCCPPNPYACSKCFPEASDG